ncbi:ABC transporter ATP-binding protein [Leucobacter zeae]|nr:ABC transporter ATP-binding protein [Leucobacter zeae]
MTDNALLTISELTLDLPNGRRLLDGISLSVAAGETVGLVGESGSGKSLTSRTVLGLTPPRAILGGSVLLDGGEVIGAPPRELLGVRRERAAMIFQDPRAGINPMRTIGDHMTESLRLCRGVPAAEARRAAVELLRSVRLPRPEDHLDQYPHEFSGGMLQRVMIAGALTSAPKLLICDEPTTALDVTTQAEIIDVLEEQRAARGMGMLFITHDLNLAASICDRVYVMSAGRVEEQGTAKRIFLAPETAYTKQLIAATPSIAAGDARGAAVGAAASDPSRLDGPPASAEPVVLARDLAKTYHPHGGAAVRAVAGASISIPRGGSLGVVGESGSGKSTLARMIVGLERPDSGELRISGRAPAGAPRGRAARLARAKSVQMVFQDPYLSLDPRIPAGRAVEDALRLHGRSERADTRRRAVSLLQAVGLREEHASAMPRTLSGGQRQRVAIARAIAIEPDLLVMDEATSALDVSVQAQVLDLIDRVRAEQGLTILFISHDLGVVRCVCDETVVMRRGVIVEGRRTEELLGAPQHEYTRHLIASVPQPVWE